MNALRTVLATAVLLLGSTGEAAETDAAPLAFNIHSQPMERALTEFGRATGLQVLFQFDVVAERTAPTVVGTLSPETALQRLLAGSNLRYEFVNPTTVTIRAKSISVSSSEAISLQTQPPHSLRLAATTSSSDSEKHAAHAEASDDGESEAHPQGSSLAEVLVTGSRLPASGNSRSQDVKVYSKEQIERSGQGTLADFLGTLPDVSVSLGDNGLQTTYGQTTVQLHGLPVGTTLILINGRRVESAGLSAAPGQQGFFDLNNIPLNAVERVEVVSEGSSAVYGSDAIAGVVNIVLRRNIEGAEMSGKYGVASDLNEKNASLAFGRSWRSGSASIVASYLRRTALRGFDRSITASNDYTAFGGPDSRVPVCNPGNVFSLDGSALPGAPNGETFAAIAPGATGNPQDTGFQGSFGALNQCSTFGTYLTTVAPTERAGFLASVTYSPWSSVEVFADLMFSHVEHSMPSAPPFIYVIPGVYFQNTVPASNPYNPFGEDVGVGYLFADLPEQGTQTTSNFLRPLLGIRGELENGWHWEASSWMARDKARAVLSRFSPDAIQSALDSTDPATALNPFVSTSPGSAALLQQLAAASRLTADAAYEGQTLGANAFMRGNIATLPAGPLGLVIGGEFNRDRLEYDVTDTYFGNPVPRDDYSRNNYSAFGEARIPILGSASNRDSDERLAATLAARRDIYQHYDGKTTPQFGIEFRPVGGLLLRGTYSEAFRAPSLVQLNSPILTFLQPIVDPASGNITVATATEGGNPDLLPETGQSVTFGLRYASPSIPGLQISVTHWRVDVSNSIQQISPQAIVDNENLFPDDVVRDPGVGGQPGPIVGVRAQFLNFGDIHVRGIDYQAAHLLDTRFGTFKPTLNATQTYRYTTALIPGAASTDRTSIANDDGNFAVRWKGIAALSWERGPFALTLAERYIGKYRDYNSTQEIGDDWFCDAYARFSLDNIRLGSFQAARNTYLAIGGVNVFNRLPQYSNYFFGTVGFDPTQADIRGRFLYGQLSVAF